MKSYRIRFKLVAIFFLVSFVSLLGVSGLFLINERDMIWSDTEFSLRLLANAKSQHLETYFEGLEHRAIDFASDVGVFEFFHSGDSEEEASKMIKYLSVNKMALDSEIVCISLLNASGETILTAGPYEHQEPILTFDELQDIPPGKAVLSSFVVHEGDEDIVVYAIALVTDPETKERLGYVVNHVELDTLSDILGGRTELGLDDDLFGWETIETLYTSSEGVVLSASHINFESLPAFHDTINVSIFEKACTTFPIMRSYKNHHSISSVGLSRCLSGGNRVIVEISSDEVFHKMYTIVWRFGLFGLLLVLAMTVLSFYPISIIIRPLERLREAVNRFKEDTRFPKFYHDKDDEIGELGVAFRSMAEKITFTDQRRREFLAMASHQLRTPMTSIKLYVELLRGSMRRTSTRQKEYLNSIDISLGQMVHLVNDLLNLSRIEEGKIRIEPVVADVSEIVQEVLKELEPLAHKAMCRIQFFPKSVRIAVDRSFFSQVVRNLVVNAIKYSPEGECDVQVILDEVRKEGKDFVRIRVQDQGIGIAPEDQPHIFEKFFRSSSACRRSTDGLGLGLYVVKNILDQIGGKISFVSKHGVGTVFTVLLPKNL